MRSVRESVGAAWVDAVLAARRRGGARHRRGRPAPCPSCSPAISRRCGPALRHFARGQRRAGIVRSAGARRLRAEGLGVEVQTKDVPDWFLNRWPDIRASDALETAATEYACQGLELDVVGLAWGGDFLRRRGRPGPRAASSARAGRTPRKDYDFIRNTYRVLLTRARYETIIWVPRGSPSGDPFHDPTRPAAEMDAIAAHLLDCGARALGALPAPTPVPTPRLL